MPVFNKYHYKPLSAEDEIRLIRLNAASREEAPLKCSIAQRRYSAHEKDYLAISYVWGEPNFSRNLEVTGDGDVSYLRITPNVDALLRHLRKLGVIKNLWIDAICLNQADEIEKAHQIPVMGRIFGEAKEVHIWVGPGDFSTSLLFTFLRQVSLLPEAEKVKMAQCIVDVMLELFGNTGIGLGCFFDFSERAWFSRRWVIQEARLARKATVHCGDSSIPLPMLTSATTRFQTLDMSSYPIKVMANLNTNTGKPPTILELLWTFQEACCLEPKDRVAALFGLARSNYGFHLDYTVQWTEMYKQIVLGVLENGANDSKLQLMLHLFEFGPVRLPSDVGYPSWVPDWSKKRLRDLPYHSRIKNLDTYEPYPASPGHLAKATLSLYHGSLQIHWNASISASQAQRVVYATKFDSSIRTENQKTERVKSLLLEFFPPASVHILSIIAVSALFEDVVQFGYPNQTLRLKSSPCDKFIENTIQQLPKPLHTTILNTLRQTSRLLEDFYLFKTKAIKSRYQDSVGYGISSQGLQPGDMMIPLWSMNWEREGDMHVAKGYKRLRTKTMLAVRGTQGESLQDTAVIPNDKKPAEKGRVVGWAVCVLLKHGSASNYDISDSTIWDDDFDGEQQCSIRLI